MASTVPLAQPLAERYSMNWIVNKKAELKSSAFLFFTFYRWGANWLHHVFSARRPASQHADRVVYLGCFY